MKLIFISKLEVHRINCDIYTSSKYHGETSISCFNSFAICINGHESKLNYIFTPAILQHSYISWLNDYLLYL